MRRGGISEADITEARRLRAAGRGWQTIGDMLGVEQASLREAVEAEGAEPQAVRLLYVGASGRVLLPPPRALPRPGGRPAPREVAPPVFEPGWPEPFRLSGNQVRVMTALLTGDVVGAEALMGVAGLSHPAGVEQVIVRCRHKLAAHGLGIETVRGRGWRLPPATRAAVWDAFVAVGWDREIEAA